MVLSSCKKFCTDSWTFWLLNSCFFRSIFLFHFLCSESFKANALKFKLNKAVYSNFMEFKYDIFNPLNESAFKINNILCSSSSSLCRFQLYSKCLHFLFKQKKCNICLEFSQNVCNEGHFNRSMAIINGAKNWFFLKL